MKFAPCPNCSRDNNDIAPTCVYCGAQIKEKLTPEDEKKINDIRLSIEMDKIRKENEVFLCCPKCCGSNLTPMKKGFSFGKAAAGFFTLGLYGIVAGSIGSGNIKLFCGGCGHTFNSGSAISLNKYQQKQFKKNLR